MADETLTEGQQVPEALSAASQLLDLSSGIFEIILKKYNYHICPIAQHINCILVSVAKTNITIQNFLW